MILLLLTVEEGILRYRGYPIEDLVEKTTFTDLSYLLLYGDCKNQDEIVKIQKKKFKKTCSYS